MKLSGKTALITGASRGLGLEIARKFVTEGANVIICARHVAQLSQAQRELQQLAGSKIKVVAKATDVVEPEQVNALVTTALQEFAQFDILVANAGIWGTKGAVEAVDWQEWSYTIDINLKGVVLLCRAVLPHFKQQHHGKILVLSGGGATKPMPYLSAYAASKAAVVRFSETLAEEVKSFNIDVNAIAPGAMNTAMLEEILVAGPEKVGQTYYQQALQQKASGGAPLQRAADLCTFLASSIGDGITGKLISAVWDPWETLPKRKAELQNSDIYTLRRIIPADRGKNWEV